MKASEITQPGLYWVIDQYCENGMAEVTERRNEAGEVTHRELTRLGIDAADELPLKQSLYAGMDFLGPFPPPGEGPKFEGFKAALEALCLAYGVELACSDHMESLEVMDTGGGRGNLLDFYSIEDCTEPPAGT